jgi:hypothetical protein
MSGDAVTSFSREIWSFVAHFEAALTDVYYR